MSKPPEKTTSKPLDMKPTAIAEPEERSVVEPSNSSLSENVTSLSENVTSSPDNATKDDVILTSPHVEGDNPFKPTEEEEVVATLPKENGIPL